MSFRQTFFRLYDRKIASGEVTFTDIGISKADFTALCIQDDFSFTRQQVLELCDKMKLSDDEANELLHSAGYDDITRQ